MKNKFLFVGNYLGKANILKTIIISLNTLTLFTFFN